MNKKRILKLIEIFKKQSDMDHPLLLKEIIDKLDENGITVNNRKTLYDDFHYLSELGYDIEQIDYRYYLNEAPFSISEIKIIIDSINSLKNLDERFLNVLKNKLYSFISVYEEKLLKNLEYHKKHSDKKFINRLEDILEALRSNKTIIIKRINHDKEEICPLFLYRENDYYYLYYHYLNSDKIYHLRFDNIEYCNITDHINNKILDKKRIIDHIDQSSSSYYSFKSTNINFAILNESDYLKNRLQDDFPNIMFTKKGFSIKASVNEVLFSKLVSYGTDIRILDQNIATKYKEYLNNIIHNN